MANDLPASFATNARALGTDVVATTLQELPASLRSAAGDPGQSAAMSRELAEALPELVEIASTEPDMPEVALSLGRLMIADTGSVLLAERAHRDRVIRCVAARHLVVVPAEAVVATMADAAPELRRAIANGCTYATFVSGPSRTADIEKVLTIGAHGPRALVVLTVTGWSLLDD
jgi:L-lactate dehydrogenase complex protein LldG